MAQGVAPSPLVGNERYRTFQLRGVADIDFVRDEAEQMNTPSRARM